MFKRKFNSSAVELLKKHEMMLVHECLTHSKKLGIASQSLKGNWKKKIMSEANFILSVTKGREALRKTILDLKKGKEKVVEDKTWFCCWHSRTRPKAGSA